MWFINLKIVCSVWGVWYVLRVCCVGVCVYVCMCVNASKLKFRTSYFDQAFAQKLPNST